MLPLNKIKRYLALLAAEVLYDREHKGIVYPEGFKEHFEAQPLFRGWANYRITWYIDENNDPWSVVALKRPLVEEWHDKLKKILPVITPEGEIVEAEEWEKRSHSMK
jgi:hypothetical protein